MKALPFEKPTVVRQLFTESQLARLAKADYEECRAVFGQSSTHQECHDNEWEGNLYESGNAKLDNRIKIEYEMYKGTGSVHAQARIDSHIMQCILLAHILPPVQQPQQRHVLSLLAMEPLPIHSVLQYHTLPDLGDHIRARLLAYQTYPLPQPCSQRKVAVGQNEAAGHANGYLASMHMCEPETCQYADGTGCMHGSILCLCIGSVLHQHTTMSRKPFITQTQIKNAAEHCTISEFAVICSLILALLLGLYPRGRKCAIFPVRMHLWRRVHSMLTLEYTRERSRKFLLKCMPLVQLAMAEYLYNVLSDYFPVECQSLHITLQTVTHATILCDLFREKAIQTGMEEWKAVTQVAQGSMDRLVRSLRGIAHACKRPNLLKTTTSNVSRSNSRVPRELFDLRVCTTNNLHCLYPSLSKNDLLLAQLLQNRLQIKLLPGNIAGEQLEAWTHEYSGSCVRASTARTLLVCTSCALLGRQVSLCPRLRYSMKRQAYFCLQCHKTQPSQRQCEEEEEPQSSIVAIDMIGKVLCVNVGANPGTRKCYVFCLRCSKVHEMLDTAWNSCPFTRAPVRCEQTPVHGPLLATTTSTARSSRTCALCACRALNCCVEVMARTEGPRGLVSYNLCQRFFCSKHAPPSNLVHASLLIDDIQLMRLARQMEENRTRRANKRQRLG